MKKYLSLLFSILSVSAVFAQSQPAPKTGGVALRVNDSTAYISSQTTSHSQGYADMFWNNQATTPHYDIWNGASYDHVFDFNAGGGGGTQDLQSVLNIDGTAIDVDMTVVDGSSGVGIIKNGAEITVGANSGAPGGAFVGNATGGKIKVDHSGADPAEGSLFIVGSDGYLDELPVGANSEVLTSDGTTASWEAAGAGVTDGNGTTVNGTAIDWSGILSADVNIGGGSSTYGITFGRTPIGGSDLMNFISGRAQDTGGILFETNNSDGIYLGGTTAGSRKILLRSTQAAVTSPFVLQGYATGSLPTASSHAKGIAYDNTTNTVKFSDGSTWSNIGGSVAVGDITGLGSSVATVLGNNAGGSGGVVIFGGAGGSPSSLTLTNATGLPGTSVINTPAGNIAATTAQAAINELDAEKAKLYPSTRTETSSTTGVIGDAGNTIEINSASPTTFTVPDDATVDYNDNTTLTIRNYGSANITITATGSVVFRLQTGGGLTIPQFGVAQVVNKTGDEWYVFNGTENTSEEVNAAVSSYTNYSTTATYQNLTSIVLTTGDWDISAFFTYSSNSATITAASNAIFVISTTTASASGATEGKNISYVPQAGLLGTSLFSGAIPSYRVTVSGTVTYYLNTQATFTVGNPQFVGSINAKRAR